ncbi:MAG: N-acetylmuramoyl-L-alanine amidase [Vicinamibacterales bacterium]
MKGLYRACTLAALAAGIAGGTRPVSAQVTAAHPPAAQQSAATADALFADASAKEAAVRKVLNAPPLQPTLLKAIRTVVSDYENVVRHYPASGYCDDALWRAAALSREAFEVFGESRERTAAMRMLRLLASQYPSSKFAKAAPEQVAWFEAHPARVTTAPVVAAAAPSLPVPSQKTIADRTPAVPAAPAISGAAAAHDTDGANRPVPQAPAAGPRLVSIKGIRRAVMKDLVRVVIELDDEVTFHDERIDGPPRVFVDLPSTRANLALIDQTLRFDADSDIVRQIRIGRHPNAVTRVVLEAAGVSSYSVYPLYSPFRLVIDCLRAAPQVAEAPAAPLIPRELPKPALTAAVTATTPVVDAPARPVTPVSVAPPAPVALPVPTVPVPPLATSPAAAATAPPDGLPAWAIALKKEPAADHTAPTPAPPLAPAPKAPDRNLSGGLSIARQLGLGVSRIVIDPGHGGHDPGAKGPAGTEADLVLDVALRLERLLAKVPGVEVVLTRRENEFVSLQERTALANRETADLFLSIHANASSVAAARGVETYFLNFASTQGAAAVAARENATSGQAMGTLQDVIKSIALNSKRDESRDFATYVQREMLASLRTANTSVKDLGVKQAPFVVLIGAEMPSVLAEISFITNPQEARLLKTNTYRQKIAQALFEGVRKYQASLKTGLAVAAQQN